MHEKLCKTEDWERKDRKKWRPEDLFVFHALEIYSSSETEGLIRLGWNLNCTFLEREQSFKASVGSDQIVGANDMLPSGEKHNYSRDWETKAVVQTETSPSKCMSGPAPCHWLQHGLAEYNKSRGFMRFKFFEGFKQFSKTWNLISLQSRKTFVKYSLANLLLPSGARHLVICVLCCSFCPYHGWGSCEITDLASYTKWPGQLHKSRNFQIIMALKITSFPKLTEQLEYCCLPKVENAPHLAMWLLNHNHQFVLYVTFLYHHELNKPSVLYKSKSVAVLSTGAPSMAKKHDCPTEFWLKNFLHTLWYGSSIDAPIYCWWPCKMRNCMCQRFMPFGGDLSFQWCTTLDCWLRSSTQDNRCEG